MTSIDAVTASFAASLALAGSDVVDITKMEGGAQRRATQSYLLARPLAPKPMLNDLRRLFRRIWVLEAGFRIQQRAEDRFLISFDLRQDRNKVLRGGPWRYEKAPVILQIFDGVSPIHQISMTELFFWVRITDVPPDFEERHTIRNIASVAGKFLELDDKLFNTTGRIRVRVSHDISKPFHFKKILKLDTDVIAEISYFFENLGSKCDVCHLIFHENGICPLAAQVVPPSPIEKTPDIPCPLLGFANQIVNGTFTFQGVKTNVLPPVSRMLFGPKEQIRKPIIIREHVLRSKDFEECSNTELTLVPVDTTVPKRGRPSSPFSSPKKIKGIPELLALPACSEAPTKKVKHPEFTSKFTSKSLSLVEVPGCVLVPKEGNATATKKKKRGRPLGSRNKQPSGKKIEKAQEACYAFLTQPPSPSATGKEKI